MAIYVAKKTTENERLTTMEEVEAKILSIAAEADADHVMDVVIELDQGAYYLKRPMVLNAEENPGLAYINLTIRPKEGMRPSIAGLVGFSGADFEQVSARSTPLTRMVQHSHSTRMVISAGEIRSA